MAGNFDVSVKLTGYNRVRNQLRALAAAHPDDTDPILEKHAKTEANRLREKPYPPKLPGQKYIRTGQLGRRFRAQKRKKGQWSVINRTEYAVWVIQKGMQNKKYHEGRWWTIQDELAKEMPKLTKNLATKLERIMEKQPD